MSVAQLVCVSVALGIQHAMRVLHIVICGLLRSTAFFHIISPKAGFSKEKVLERRSVFRVSLQLLSEIFFFLRRNVRDMFENVYWFSYKVPLYSCQILKKFDFS